MFASCGRAHVKLKSASRLSTGSSFIQASGRCLSGGGDHNKVNSTTLLYPPSSSTQHSDLATFLEYARRSGLDEKSTVYVGTHYEYTVASTLTKYGFYLRRIGGASDYGTDLLGTWTLPTTPQTMKVLVQCKAGLRIGPHYVRELEGAFAGAPVGWRGAGVLGLLVAERPATKGVRDSLARSRWPMGFINCSKDGGVQQMLWNRKAEEEGLEGLGIIARHDASGRKVDLVLVKDGKTLPFADESE